MGTWNLQLPSLANALHGSLPPPAPPFDGVAGGGAGCATAAWPVSGLGALTSVRALNASEAMMWSMPGGGTVQRSSDSSTWNRLSSSIALMTNPGSSWLPIFQSGSVSLARVLRMAATLSTKSPHCWPFLCSWVIAFTASRVSSGPWRSAKAAMAAVTPAMSPTRRLVRRWVWWKQTALQNCQTPMRTLRCSEVSVVSVRGSRKYSTEPATLVLRAPSSPKETMLVARVWEWGMNSCLTETEE